MLLNTETASPVYLRDLKPELRVLYTEDIKLRPELQAALDNGDDLVVGYYRDVIVLET